MESPTGIQSENTGSGTRNLLVLKSPLAHVFLWIGLYAIWILIFRNHAITISRTMGIEF